MTEAVEKTSTYREGFVAGARAILGAIGDDLPEQQMRVLRQWVDKSLDDWRAADADASQPVVPMIDGA